MLGEKLIAKGFLTQAQLQKALEEQKKNASEKLGEIVVRLGFCTKEQVDSCF